jgi:hypothetical protein
MATVKPKKMSHPVEIIREVYALKDSSLRLLGVVKGLNVSGPISAWSAAGDSHDVALQLVLRESIALEAAKLVVIARRLNGLLGPDSVKLGGGA